jgi:very-short-patch-repair endonuclease
MFLGSQAMDRLGLTRKQLRGTAWMRLGRDVYADSRMGRDHEIACHAAALRMPPEAAFAGPSAAYLLGVEHAAAFEDPVHLVVPEASRMPSRRGVRVHRVRLRPSDVDDTGGLPRTSPARTVWDLASWLEPVASVPVIDTLLGLGVVDAAALVEYIAARQGQRGHLRAGRAVALADGRAQSPPESVLRVRLVLAGLPMPVPQFDIRIGSVTVHPDLAWPEYKVAAEYDGVWHASAEQLRRDRRRLNLLMTAGWGVLHVTGDRLRRDVTGVIAEIRTALRSRGWPG